MLDLGYLARITPLGSNKEFVGKSLLYRWSKDESPFTLNKKRNFSGTTNKKDAVKVAAKLQSELLHLEEKHIKQNGVDYHAISESKRFDEYVNASLEMQVVNLSDLTENQRKVFFINIYNALVIHATIELGCPTTSLQRNRFFNRVSYEIGGYTFSLNDIEHGILRCNRKAPGKLKKQFSSSDPRKNFQLTKFDERIHFALVCGAKSCPPVKIYTEENMDNALQWAAEGFCADEVEVYADTRTVKISKLFSWYKKDFGKSNRELVEHIAKFRKEDTTLKKMLDDTSSITVKYHDYDWDSNGRGHGESSESISGNTDSTLSLDSLSDNEKRTL